MGEILELYNNDPAFAPLLWDSEWINVGNASLLILTGYCSENFDFGVRFSIDTVHDIIDEDTYSVLAFDSYTITSPVKSRFVQLYIKNIASSPSILRSQGFFVLDGQVRN